MSLVPKCFVCTCLCSKFIEHANLIQLLKFKKCLTFSGGNQRDLARQKNLKKQQETSKTKKADDKDGNKGMSLQDRKQRYVYLLHVYAC